MQYVYSYRYTNHDTINAEVILLVTDAQKKATAKYESENYDKVLLRIRPKGIREQIKKHAESKGFKSLNAYVNDLIDKDMQ